MVINIVDPDAHGSAEYLVHAAFEKKYRRRLMRWMYQEGNGENVNAKPRLDRHIRKVARTLAAPHRFTEPLIRDVLAVAHTAVDDSDEITSEFDLGQFFGLCISLTEGHCWRHIAIGGFYSPDELPAWLRKM